MSVKKLIKWIWFAITILLCLVTIFSAFGGMISPARSVIPSIVAMAYPGFLVLTLVALVINLFVSKRFMLVQVFTILVTISAFWNFCPLNLITPSTEGKRAVELMTYNVFHFRDVNEEEQQFPNVTISQMINSNADFIFGQELTSLILGRKSPFQEQFDSLRQIYPHMVTVDGDNPGDVTTCILSKTPLKQIKLGFLEESKGAWAVAETVVEGDTLLLVSVHLRSLYYMPEEREIYQQITEISGDVDLKEASRALYPKLAAAFRVRAKEVDYLRHQLDSLNYKNVILGGDFNEVACGYAERTLSGGEMHSAFSKAGLGPMITYYKDRFYFHIDHILYQGNLRAVKIRRGTIKSSDHYPVYATFIIN